MKGIFIALLLFLSVNSYSQSLVKYNFDNDVFIHLPKNSVVTDTLDQKMIKGNIGGMNVIFIKTIKEEEKVVLENEADLIDFYTGFEKGYSKSINGKILNHKIIDRDNLKLAEFDCKSTINNLTITFECLVVYLNHHTYAVQFFNLDPENEDYKTQKAAILASLQFRKGLTIDNQLTNPEESSMAYKIGEIIGYFLGVAVLIILILVILKKSKERRLPKS